MKSSEPVEAFHEKQVIELVSAAEKGDVQAIELLVKGGVDVNARGDRGVTPLLQCLSKANKDGFRALLENGADPNLLNSDGNAVMHLAAREPDPFFMQEALAHGGDPNLPNTGNRFSPNSTPLFYAVENHASLDKEHQGSHPENARLLIAGGADVNHKNADGRTPLDLAANGMQCEAMLVLLEAGANFRVVKPGGDSFPQWIEQHRDHDWDLPGTRPNEKEFYLKVCEFLRSHGVEMPAAKE